MNHGLELIRRAETLLQDQRLSPKGRLRHAARLIWSALYFHEDWPAWVRPHTNAVQELMFRHGPIDQTVARLNDHDVSEMIDGLTSFVRLFGPDQWGHRGASTGDGARIQTL